MALLRDGKIVIGGSFASYGGAARPALARLHADGALDEEFQPAGLNRAERLAVLPDGSVVAADYASSLPPLPRLLKRGPAGAPAGGVGGSGHHARVAGRDARRGDHPAARR